MTNNEKIIKIREQLAKITPWPWRFYTEPQPNGCPIIGNLKGLMIAMLAHSVKEPTHREEGLGNADFIANSPADIEFLLAIIDGLESAPDGVSPAKFHLLRDELKATNETLVLIVEERDALLEANRALQLERDMALLAAEEQSRALIEYAPTILRAEEAHGQETPHD